MKFDFVILFYTELMKLHVGKQDPNKHFISFCGGTAAPPAPMVPPSMIITSGKNTLFRVIK